MGLVCPNCGSDRVGTQEEAVIWQSATFTYTDEGMGSFEDAEGRQIDADWDMYDSEDVGDTDTTGFFCRGCQSTWDGRTCPFIPSAEREPMTAADKEAYIKQYAGLVWNVGSILEDRRSGDYEAAKDGAIWEYLYENLDGIYEVFGRGLDQIEREIFGKEE